MKKVFLISKNEKVNYKYAQDLHNIFEGYIELKNFSFEGAGNIDLIRNFRNEIYEADITIVADEALISDIQNNVGFGRAVDYLKFAFQTDELKRLNEIPRNSNILVCFYNFSKALNAAALMYESGYRDFNLYPIGMDNNVYNIDDLADVDYAVTFGQIESVPPDIKNVIDLKYRKISFSTLMNIALKLNILDSVIEERIADYASNTSFENLSMKHLYDQTSRAKGQLRLIIDKIDCGVLIYDDSYDVMDINDNFLKIFGIQSNSQLKSTVFSLINSSEICNVLMNKTAIENRLFKLKGLGKNILVTKNRVNDKCFLLIVKDVTDIMNLERSLRRSITKKGYVAKYTFDDIVGDSDAITNALKKAKKIADIDRATLILGESGTGKEMFAQSIHNASSRRNYPFVAINCASLSPTLLESELFGYEEGSFTGSKKGGKAGMFELAHNGTLFLDEICEIPFGVQGKLLRALAENEIMRVGGTDIVSVNTRVIAATHKDIGKLVKDNRFRLDLYYRINVLTLKIPPLKDRKSDIPLLAADLIEQERLPLVIPDHIMDMLMMCNWDGNVRELKNCIEYMAYTSEGEPTVDDFPDYIEINDVMGEYSGIFSGFTVDERRLAERILYILRTKSAGRRKIVEMLKNRGLEVSDYGVRSMLVRLKDVGLVEYRAGREGVHLTDTALNYMKV